jgi:mono/diheme cytochrome c family protein
VARPRLPAGRRSRIVVLILLGLVALFLVAQAVPYGRGHSNPRVTKEPAWDSARTRALAARACFDCHSNLTRWPWYSNVAPESWLIQRDVDEGRSTLNFSEWDQPQDTSLGDVLEALNGGMPPWYYKLLHSRSRLSATEKAQLADGLQRTLRVSPPVGGGGG